MTPDPRTEPKAEKTEPRPDVTRVLAAVEAGDPRAAAELLPLVYEELRELARRRLTRESAGHTLQATALVHEAYLRLVRPSPAERDSDGQRRPHWDGRGHFFAAAAEAMRRVLVEAARRRQCLKRGGQVAREERELDAVAAPAPDDDLLALDEAMDRLSAANPAAAELVKLRYFAGLTIEQAAEAQQVSLATAKRRWAYAKAWLYGQLKPEASPTDRPGRPGRPGH